MSVFSTLQYILQHPLNRTARRAALKRWFKWQVGSRLVPGDVLVPFVNNTVLVVSPGMTGATQNIYTGLHEFEDCGFLLHLLRSVPRGDHSCLSTSARMSGSIPSSQPEP